MRFLALGITLPRRLGIGLLTLLAFAALPAHAWWDDAWTLRKQIVVDTTANGANLGAAATNVTVLVRLHAGNFTRFADLKPDGSDLRFVAVDDKTPLQFHIERLDIQQEIALVWVLVPQVAGNSDQNAFFMYFGNNAVLGIVGLFVVSWPFERFFRRHPVPIRRLALRTDLAYAAAQPALQIVSLVVGGSWVARRLAIRTSLPCVGDWDT